MFASICNKRRKRSSSDDPLKDVTAAERSSSDNNDDMDDDEPTSTEDFEGNEEAPKAEHVYVDILADSWLEIKDPNFYRAIVAELLATLIIVYFSNMGVLAAVNAFEGCCGGGLHTFVLVYFFLLIVCTIYAFAPLSGAHFNPAITFTLLLCRRVTPVRAAAYILAQLSGAIAGAGFTYLSVPEQLRGDLTTPSLNPLASAGEGIATEFFITFGLVFGTFATAFDPRGWGHLGPFWIGAIVAVNAHAGAFISSAAMNPARAFGCAVISGKWDHQYVFWVGDMVGGALGGLIYEWLFMFRTHARVKGVPSTSGDNHIHKYRKQ